MLNCFSGCITEGKPQQRSLKKTIQENDKTSPSSIEHLSTKTDGSQRRYITQELAKHGNGKILAECFTYKELSDVTKKFNPEFLIGEGGFGRVYKGHIDSKEIDVAIKQLDRDGFQGNREFLVEVLVLSRLHHQNLVNLVGYCAEGNHRLLVYEHMPNGSLEDHLLNISSDRKPLEWNTRMKIIEGAARGLEYLHEIADPPVIYRDFKASNILLDTNFSPKLSDFGFAKLVPVDENENILTRVVGTYGYCAPEYASTGMLSTKSDVYSFGVVLLEMISGRRVIDTSRPSKERNMIEWAEPLFKDKKKFYLMVDPLLQGNYPEKELQQALAIAAMCLQEEADTRPYMADVVTALEYLSARRNPADNSNKTDEDEEQEENGDDHDKNE